MCILLFANLSLLTYKAFHLNPRQYFRLYSSSPDPLPQVEGLATQDNTIFFEAVVLLLSRPQEVSLQWVGLASISFTPFTIVNLSFHHDE